MHSLVAYLPLHQRVVINSHQPYTKRTCSYDPKYNMRNLRLFGEDIPSDDKITELYAACCTFDKPLVNLRSLTVNSGTTHWEHISTMTKLVELSIIGNDWISFELIPRSVTTLLIAKDDIGYDLSTLPASITTLYYYDTPGDLNLLSTTNVKQLETDHCVCNLNLPEITIMNQCRVCSQKSVVTCT